MTAVVNDCLSRVMLLTLHNNVKMFFNQVFKMKIIWCQNIFSNQSALLKNITELCISMTTSLKRYRTAPSSLTKKGFLQDELVHVPYYTIPTQVEALFSG